MNIRSPIGQATFLLLLSCIIGISSNLFSSNSIPWIAPELNVAEAIDTTSDEAVLVAIFMYLYWHVGFLTLIMRL